MVGIPSGRSPPPGFGIFTRRTACGVYVFARRSFLIPFSHSSNPGPIKGHEFGLKLTPDDKAALIAFLKTL